MASSGTAPDFDAVVIGAGFCRIGHALATARADWVCPPKCTKRVPESAALGTGTATQGHGATPRATFIASRSPRSYFRIGTGVASSRSSQRSYPTSTRRGPLRPSPQHPVQHASHLRKVLRGHQPMGGGNGSGRLRHRPIPNYGRRMHLDGQCSRHKWARLLRG